MKLIGLDIGTTGCKACLFESTGELLGSASREYPVDIPHPGWAEQDGERVWQLAQECLGELLAASGRPDVAAIGLSVQGEAVMPLDKAGRPLRPMILGMDTRTGAQNDWLVERLGAQFLFERTGMPVHTVNTLPKLLWIRQNEPHTWRTARQFVLYEDFLILRMTGQAAISRCLASRTQLFDLHADRWSDEILAAIGLEPDRLSPVASSAAPVGRMDARLAQQLGFPNPPLVVTGGHDQACGALGVGLTRPGLSMVSTGTAEVLEVALGSPVVTESLRQGNISVYAHVVPGLFLAMMLNHSGGLLLRWFRDVFCQAEKDLAAAGRQDAYDVIFGGTSPDPSPLLLLPHFAGSGTPTFDTQSKGAILGLTFTTSKADVAKAILEGLTFDELRAIGGGPRSARWLQLKADITGIPVAAPRITEAASWGAAVLGGVGAGCFASPAEAVEGPLVFENRYTADPGRQRRYQDRYSLYRKVYPAAKEILHALS